MTKDMGARRHCCSSQRGNLYQFKLRGKGAAFIKDTIIVDFTPVKALSWDSRKSKLSSFSITPAFNFDRKFYSPAFTNSYQGMESDSHLKKEYTSRVKEQSTQILSERILLPKPRSSEVCFVCRQFYQDYLEVIIGQGQHIRSSQHNKAVTKSIFNSYIHEMIEQQAWKKGKKTIKSRKIIKRQRSSSRR